MEVISNEHRQNLCRANEYSVKNTSKVMALKKLDKKVKDFPLAVSLVIGVVSALVLGTGMCLSMGVLGGGTAVTFIAGIILGVLGIIGVSVNYPRSMYAEDIIRLANEISNKV